MNKNEIDRFLEAAIDDFEFTENIHIEIDLF